MPLIMPSAAGLENVILYDFSTQKIDKLWDCTHYFSLKTQRLTSGNVETSEVRLETFCT